MTHVLFILSLHINYLIWTQNSNLEMATPVSRTFTCEEPTTNRMRTTTISPMDHQPRMHNEHVQSVGSEATELYKCNSDSACQGLHPAPAAARCGYVLNPGKKQGRGAWVSEGRFPACQPALARSYRERGSDPPSSH